jgi:glutaredoxin
MKNAMLLTLLILGCAAAQADVYRWVDANGEVHYSDHPPPPTIKQVETRKADGGKPSAPPLPYALQQAVKNFPVTLYTSSCGDACAQARQLLAKRGIPFTEMDATDPATQEELKKLTGGNIEVPVLKVGRSILRGFEQGQWNVSLDAAGYPATALIAPPAPVKPGKPAAAATQPPAAAK